MASILRYSSNISASAADLRVCEVLQKCAGDVPRGLRLCLGGDVSLNLKDGPADIASALWTLCDGFGDPNLGSIKDAADAFIDAKQFPIAALDLLAHRSIVIGAFSALNELNKEDALRILAIGTSIQL